MMRGYVMSARDRNVDWLKGFAIILMIIGHVGFIHLDVLQMIL